LTPNEDWENDFMDGFEYFRNVSYDAAWEHTEAATAEQNAVHKLPPVSDKAAWRHIMAGGQDTRSNAEPPWASPGGRPQPIAADEEVAGITLDDDAAEAELETRSKCAAPQWELVARLKVSVAARLVCDHGTWLVDRRRLYTGGARWLFVLLARVDDVLDAATMSAVREVLRVASQERCRLGAELESDGVDLTSEAVHENSQLAELNILITLSGKYFGQLDR